MLIFTSLIAYDSQRPKTLYGESEDDTEKLRTAADIGAWSLYLDFTNFFQFLSQHWVDAGYD